MEKGHENGQRTSERIEKMKNLSDYVYIENIFSKQFCNNLVSEIKTLELSSHTWYGYGGDNFINMKDFMVTYSNKLQQEMQSSIYSLLMNYVNNIGSSFAIHQLSDIRFNVYDIGSGIKEHIDHIHSLFDGEQKGIPILSIVGLLNNDYEGGKFVLCDREVHLDTGDAIVFPSVFLYPHLVTPIKSGVRYSWVVWAY